LNAVNAPTGKSNENIRAIGVLLSMSAAALGLTASDQPASVTDPSMEPTMMRIDPYPDEMYTPPGVAPAVPYAWLIMSSMIEDSLKQSTN